MAPPKLFKAADVCDMVQVQPYVLRSWEKEFPGIGVQKSPDAARLYRQSDIDQVQRIKQLVFGEGLTLSGARRRLEEMAPTIERAQRRGSRRGPGRAGVECADAYRQRPSGSAVDSHAAVECPGHGRAGERRVSASAAAASRSHDALAGCVGAAGASVNIE